MNIGRCIGARGPVRVIALAGVATGLGIALTGRGSQTAADRAAQSKAAHSDAMSERAAAPGIASPPGVQPAITSTGAPASAPSVQAKPAAVAVAQSQVPHFATPDAAARYLVTAYNTGDDQAMRHVTNPDSRAQFEPEREWVKTFRFRSCSPDQGAHTYTCVLDIVTKTAKAVANADPASSGVMDEVTVVMAPAARPGWYLLVNQGCGGG